MENYEDRTKFLFDRFDKYFAIVNTKGTVYLTVNTFFIGAFLTNLNNLNAHFIITEVTALFIGIFLTLCFLSITISLLAINPFLSNGTKGGQAESLFYYGSIAEFDRQKFLDRFEIISPECLKEDLGSQLHCLAVALKSKYHKLAWAGKLILTEFILLIPIIIILCLNLKS